MKYILLFPFYMLIFAFYITFWVMILPLKLLCALVPKRRAKGTRVPLGTKALCAEIAYDLANF